MEVSGRNMERRDSESIGEERTNDLVANRCCSFCIPCVGSRRSSSAGLVWWERIRSTQVHEESFWFRGIQAFKKLREWSEIVAGPKWKTFIRRFNRNRSGAGIGGGLSRHGSKFQYDPLSYALNFDEGLGQNNSLDADEDHPLFRNFSTRYASVPSHMPIKSPSALDSGKDMAVFA